VAAAWLSDPQEWHPLVLFVLLVVIALGGEFFTVETSSGILSASLGAMVLAMGLLGPGPAGVCGIAAIGLHSLMGRRAPAQWRPASPVGLTQAEVAAALTLRPTRMASKPAVPSARNGTASPGRYGFGCALPAARRSPIP
jgi:hypothetical protein